MLILSLSSALLVSCAQIPSDPCAGWKPIYMAPGTPEWLDIHDRQALIGIVTHDEFYEASCQTTGG